MGQSYSLGYRKWVYTGYEVSESDWTGSGFISRISGNLALLQASTHLGLIVELNQSCSTCAGVHCFQEEGVCDKSSTGIFGKSKSWITLLEGLSTRVSVYMRPLHWGNTDEDTCLWQNPGSRRGWEQLDWSLLSQEQPRSREWVLMITIYRSWILASFPVSLGLGTRLAGSVFLLQILTNY